MSKNVILPLKMKLRYSSFYLCLGPECYKLIMLPLLVHIRTEVRATDKNGFKVSSIYCTVFNFQK